MTRRRIHIAETYTPTYLLRQLTAEAVASYGCTPNYARRLVRRALTDAAVRAAVLEQVGQYLADDATATVTDTEWSRSETDSI